MQALRGRTSDGVVRVRTASGRRQTDVKQQQKQLTSRYSVRDRLAGWWIAKHESRRSRGDGDPNVACLALQCEPGMVIYFGTTMTLIFSLAGGEEGPQRWSWKGSHDSLEGDQGHCISWERSQDTRQEAAPVRSPPAALSAHGDSGVSPSSKFALSVTQRAAQRIRHDTLLDDVGRVGGHPEDLRSQSAGPEVDGRCREICVLSESAREDVIAAPEAEEERAEDQGRAEAVIEPW